jgi:hypothetical protein
VNAPDLALLQTWKEFYVATAGAAATLFGLVFVGVSILLSGKGVEVRMRGLAIESAVGLVYPLMISFVMLNPEAFPWVQVGGLLALSALGLIASRAAWRDATTGSGPAFSRVTLVFQFLMPAGAFGVLIVATIGLLIAPELAILAIGGVVFVLLLVGAQSAWELVLRAIRPTDAT